MFYDLSTAKLLSSGYRESLKSWLKDYLGYDEETTIPIGTIGYCTVLVKGKNGYFIIYGYNEMGGLFDHRYCRELFSFHKDPNEISDTVGIESVIQLAQCFLESNIYVENHDYSLRTHLIYLCDILLDKYRKETLGEV